MARPRSRSKARKRQTQRRRPTARDAMAARSRKTTTARKKSRKQAENAVARTLRATPTRRVPRDLAAETEEEPMGGVRQEPRTRRRAATEPS